MNKTLELIWKAIANPIDAFKEIKEEKPVYAALIYLLIYGIVSVLAAHFAGKNGIAFPQNGGNLPPNAQAFFKDFSNSIKSLTTSTPFFILGLIVPYINVFVSVSIYELIAQFVTKKANGLALFTAWSFASIPILIYKLLDILFATAMNYNLPGWIELIFILWGITLYVFAIKETYETDTASAIGIYFTPIIALLILVILYVIMLFPLFGSLFKSIPGGVFTP